MTIHAKEINYEKLVKDLSILGQSDNKEDKLLYAYHYGNFGFNAIAAQKLIECDIDYVHVAGHLNQLDSFYPEPDYYSKPAKNDYSSIPRGNVNLKECKTFQITFDFYDDCERECGVYLSSLPYIELIKNKLNCEKIYLNCSERMRELLEKYFPYIEIGTCENKITQFEMLEYVYNNGGSELVKNCVLNIANRISKKQKKYVGINWFSNILRNRYRSIPIGTLINTVGSHSKNLDVLCMQYNNPYIEIEIFNRHSKNKITKKFDSDLNTPLLDVVEAIDECHSFVGIQSEASIIAYSLFAIPTIVTASSPCFYWFGLNDLNPFLIPARMRFQGDYDFIINCINKNL